MITTFKKVDFSTSNIPEILKKTGYFCTWCYELDTKKSPKLTKVPKNPKTGKNGKSTDKRTFSDFQTALQAYQNGRPENGLTRFEDGTEGLPPCYSGIGIGVFDSVVAVDVDSCLLDGALSDHAMKIIDFFDTYTEISPSGEGIRLICVLDSDKPFCYDKAKHYTNNPVTHTEIYVAGCTNKFVTLTGNNGDSGENKPVAKISPERLQEFLDRFMLKSDFKKNKKQGESEGQIILCVDNETANSGKTPTHTPNSQHRTFFDNADTLITTAVKSKNGEKFQKLLSGDMSDYNDNHSVADMAFCNMLAFWTGCNPEMMDSIFRQSGLMRPKWDEVHDGKRTYGEMTLATAISDCGETYSPEHTANSRQQARENHQKYVSPYDVDGTGRLTIANLQAYMQRKGFSVAYDEILRENVFGTVDGESKLHLPETMPTIIKDDLQGELKGVNRDNICAMLDLIASRNIVNPIRSMIEGTKWDGIDRLKQFYDLFEIPETDTLSRVLIRKWAMQCICGLYNQYEHPFSLDVILVFQGKQGIAKTRFFEHLAMMPEYFKESAVLDPANKDSVIECTGVWIGELGEIGSTMRKDIDRVKGFLTQSTDTYRQPYGRKALKYPRRTSFVGTVNDEKFLLDTTGNRRFASVPLTLTHTLNYETQIKTFNALQFWAQILQIVRDAIANGATFGGCFRLDETEKQNLETRNSSLLKLLPFEQEFLDCMQDYERQKAQYQKSVEYRFCTITEWLTQNRYYMGSCSSVQLGKILAKNGYVQERVTIDGKRTRAYKLPFRTVQQV